MNKKMIVISGAVALGIANAAAFAAPASATPPCQLNWELKSDGQCHPYYSTGPGVQYCHPTTDENGWVDMNCGGS